ncbi:hypothetical protein V2A60_007633 [Cordyceps javanica]|uniref:Conserved lysine-rich protein n=1 Tax=Cordyceps javanica TaxID=43265 RepID=A0A545VAL7_9HYPO|nr:conserved lysine-rich protein [Cordyceps javanica]TQW09867.1 conserved lysine-rich protein [Cordyceps javanica]
MADIQKPLEVPAAPVEQVDAAVVVPETAPALDVAAAEPATTVAEETKIEEPAPVAAEEAKEEAKPVEEGHLGYKAQGLSFPKNLLGSKEYFFFSSEAFEAKALEAYKKAQKSAEGALDNISWAAHTGKGLLFSGDKKAPNNVINLSHASEPEVDGNKFHFTAKGNKHTFKAANVAERDNWVAQIKAKIAEAKEIAASVTESEAYKNTLESLKPTPKEETKAAEPAVAEESADAAKTEETPKEEAEAAKEEPKTEEPKRRSASRKRASFFGFGKKDTLPKEEPKTEESPIETAEEGAAETTEPKVEDAAAQDVAAPTETEEPVAEVVKPTANKRNSFFGGVFSKKEKKAADSKTAETTEAATEEPEVAAESAPVIPPVDTTTPLAEEVIAADPVEAAAPEIKTDTKEKRKSSLPFFGKRDASPTTGEAKTGAFSKLRATIKGKGAAKAEEAKEEATKSQETAGEAVTDAQDKTEETIAAGQEQVTKDAEGEKKTEAATAAPVVTASA